ncbi:MAG TPA: DUF4124 domain-containing protein [Pseudomonadota bacterium]|jgi:hypothetical protein|nr:DUF4124 domain-containing protein [Pseudomonadota bacterium]
MALKLHHAVLGGLVLAAVIWAFGRDADDAPRNRDLRQENGTTETRSRRTVALYKWQDDAGVWNYTDQPPADRPFERITGTPNVNSVPSVVPDSGLVEPSTPPAQ